MSRKNVIVGLCVMQVLLWITPLFAQVPDTLWTRTFGDIGQDYARCVQPTSDSGYILTGMKNIGVGYGAVYLIKTDAAGDTLWTRIYGGLTYGHYDRGYSIQQTSDGGYIIVGEKYIGFMNEYDVWMIKTDAFGDTLWTRTFGGNMDDYCFTVIESVDSSYVLVWNLTGINVVRLVKWDANGNWQWAQNCGDGVGHCLLQTQDGGYIITGTAVDGLLLIRTDSLGDTLWTKTYIGYFSYGSSVAITQDNGFVITGFTNGDIVLLKTDSLGDSLWARTYGCDSFEDAHAVCPATDGGYTVVGYTNSFGAGAFDLYLIGTDSLGNTLWELTYGGVYADAGLDMKQTSDGSYIVTGYTASFGAGDYDVWLLKFGTDVGIVRSEQIMSDHFQRATIVSGPLQLPGDATFRIFDIMGRVVQPDKIQPGIYFIEVDGVMTQKVVKVR